MIIPNMQTLRISKQERHELQSLIRKSRIRVAKVVNDEFEYHHIAIARSNRFLHKYDSKRVPMFVLFVDLGGSTKMSSELDPDILVKIIRVFSQEMAYVIDHYGGNVLKYVGDAVIGYFPVLKKNSSHARRIINCAHSMLSIIENGINPMLQSQNYPPLVAKISIDFGRNSVIRYGADRKRSHIDLIGLSMNLVAKMQTLGKPNQIIIGNKAYRELSVEVKSHFKRFKVSSIKWPYHDFVNTAPYPVFWTQFCLGQK